LDNKKISSDEVIGALDHLRIGMAIFDSDDRLVYHNGHFRYMYMSLEDVETIDGWTFEQLLRHLMDSGEFAGLEVIEDPEGWIASRLENHRKKFNVATERLATGKWIEIKERSLGDGRAICIWSDATEQNRYLARLEAAMDCIADGFAVWDQMDNLVRFNERFASRFDLDGVNLKEGQSRETVLTGLAESGLLVLTETPAEWVDGILKRAMSVSHHTELEFTDDTHFILAERRSSDGGIVSALTDITELKHKERELIFRGKSLEEANSELEMVNDSLERQGAELVHMAEQIDASHTALKLRDAALAKMEARQRAVLNTIADALVVVDKQGYIEILNPMTESVMGLAGEQAHGRALGELIQVEVEGELIGDIPAYLAAIHEEMEDSGEDASKHVELTIRRRDGTSLPVEMAIDDVESLDHHFYVITLRDISERKVAERNLQDAHDSLERRVDERTEELSKEIEEHRKTENELNEAKLIAEDANWAKSQFLANMSHELRTPLNGIIGFSEMLKEEYFGAMGNEKYQEYATDINMSGQHLLALINDILDLSKIELGAMDLEEGYIDVGAVIETCVAMVRDRAGRERITLSVEGIEGLPLLYGDERRVKQILLNVLSNAVKFTPPGGEVTIAQFLSDRGGYCISVEDTGVGISADDINRILQPFTQVADSHTRDYEGVGLGLSICKSLIQAHGGELALSSEVGKGTRVEILFPPERTVVPKDG